ncbi:hypothetical protein AB0L05_42150 [Nonomuraea pusilla]|uniref:hypothetical protein n=1 Tax=Nonomuraea pusilla TaxID=46177 RepID=UPI0033263557
MIATLALPISMMAAPAVAEPDEPSPSPTATVQPSGGKSPTDLAFKQAKKENQRIEIEALRSETATYYANPDGKTLHAELTTTPIRVMKDGVWQPVDTTLVERDGLIQPKAVKDNIVLSSGDDTTLIKVAGNEGPASIAAPNTLPKPRLKDNTATYSSAYGRGIDLIITVTPSGF